MAIGWIRLDVHMPEHRKSRRLAKLLDDRAAWRYVVTLWVWAAKHAEDGVLPPEDVDIIAEECGWAGEPSEFIDVLVSAGWIDRDGELLVVHDWDEFQGTLVERRLKNRRRKRLERKRRRAQLDGEPSIEDPSCHADVQGTSRGRPDARARAGAPLRSVPSRSVSSGVGGETEGNGRAEPDDAGVELSAFDRLWEVYPRKQRKRQAEATWNDVRDEAPPIQDLVDAVKLWRRTEQWTAEGGRYVPLLHKWLSEQRWLEPPVISGPHFDQIPQEQVREVLGRLEESLHWRNA